MSMFTGILVSYQYTGTFIERVAANQTLFSANIPANIKGIMLIRNAFYLSINFSRSYLYSQFPFF